MEKTQVSAAQVTIPGAGDFGSLYCMGFSDGSYAVVSGVVRYEFADEAKLRDWLQSYSKTVKEAGYGKEK